MQLPIIGRNAVADNQGVKTPCRRFPGARIHTDICNQPGEQQRLSAQVTHQKFKRGSLEDTGRVFIQDHFIVLVQSQSTMHNVLSIPLSLVTSKVDYAAFD